MPSDPAPSKTLPLSRASAPWRDSASPIARAIALLTASCYQAPSRPDLVEHGGRHDPLPSRSPRDEQYGARRHDPERFGGSRAGPEARRNTDPSGMGPPAVRSDATNGLPGAD